MQHEYFEVDVFATAPFSGNPLGVITGADSLTTAQMQKTPVVHRSFDLRSETYRLYDDVTYYYRKNFVYEQ